MGFTLLEGNNKDSIELKGIPLIKNRSYESQKYKKYIIKNI